MGEEWVFSRYHSINDVWVEGQRIAKDVMLLDEPEADTSPNSIMPRSMADRLAPYSCYATIILYGPLVQGVIELLASEYDKISVFKTRAPEDIIWSLSPVTARGGAVLRVAGKETELVRRWLGEALVAIQDIVGLDVYRSAFLS
jgi:urease accessory protein